MFLNTNDEDTRDLSDEELIVRAKAKPWLFSLILDRYQEAFLRKARGFVRTEEDAEEIVQDAFTKIYMHADSFTPQEGAKFSSWAYRILINTACTKYQKLVREGQRVMPLDPEYEHMVVGSELVIDERRDALDRVLERLPEHFSYVLRLHYLERWSHKDIADETGETVGTVKARIHRAKAAFRNETNDAEVTTLLK